MSEIMGKIMAVVTVNEQKISGGVPIFYVDNHDQLQKLSFSLEKILDATAHDLKDGLMILVKHE